MVVEPTLSAQGDFGGWQERPVADTLAARDWRSPKQLVEEGELAPTIQPGGHGWRGMRGDGSDPAVLEDPADTIHQAEDVQFEIDAILTHDTASGRSGDNPTPGPDEDGRVRPRPAGMGAYPGDGPSPTLKAAGPPAAAFHAVELTPEYGQGADLRAREVDVSGALDATALTRSTDRGVRIVEDGPVPPAEEAKTLLARPRGGFAWAEDVEDYIVQPEELAGPVKARTFRGADTDDAAGGSLIPEVHVGQSATLNSPSGGGHRLDADQAASMVTGGTVADDDPLLPPKLDSHRYRVCGNGVVAPCAFWVGWGIAEYRRGRLRDGTPLTGSA